MMTKNHRKISDIFETQFSIVLQVSTQIINCNVCFNSLEAKKKPYIFALGLRSQNLSLYLSLSWYLLWNMVREVTEKYSQKLC